MSSIKVGEVSEGRRGMNGGFIVPQFMLCGHGVSCTNRSQCCFILRCILLLFSTLSCYRLFFFKSFFIVLFDAKRTKNFCTRKVYSQVLFVHDASDHSVKHLLVMVAYGLFAGCCGTRFTRVWGIIYTRVTLKHPRTMACNLHRLPLNTLTVQVSPLATSYPCC